MARKPNISPQQPPLKLVGTQKNAEEKIQSRIDKGQELQGKQIPDRMHLEAARSEYGIWSDYNKQLLKTLFTNDELAQEYEGPGFFVMGGGRPSLQEDLQEFKEDVKAKIQRLRSIQERLNLIPSES